MIWRSSYPEVPVGGTTVPAMVQSAIDGRPDQTAMIDGTGRGSGTDPEFGRRVERISAWLSHHGVTAGHPVALWAPNTPPWAACALATMRLSARVTALNPAWTAEEAARQLADAGATVVVTTPGLAGLAADLPGIRHVVVLGENTRATALHEVLSCEYATPPMADDEDAIAFLPYSSGTMGLPKGVLLTHTNLTTMIRQVQAVARFTERDVVLALAPFFHVLGGVVTMAVPLAAGATVVTVARFDP